MITLAITLIVKNEEECLERLLKCLSFADEIIIVDTGSEDKTKKIALKYTNDVYDYKWDDNFSNARNFAISKAKSSYFMWLDADDYIEKEDQNKIIELKNKIKDEDIVLLPYVLNNNVSFYRERIIRNNGYHFEGAVHECISLNGKIVYYNIPIYHKKIKHNKSNRNLLIYQKLNREKKLNARELYYFANELKDNHFYDEAILKYKEFLKRNDASNVNKIDACLKLSSIYKELNCFDKADFYIVYSLMHGIHTSLQILYLIQYYFKIKEYETSILYAKSMLCFVENPLAFNYLDNKDYYAYLYLGLCYYYLKDKKSALFYNNEALKIKENDPIALKNKSYYL